MIKTTIKILTCILIIMFAVSVSVDLSYAAPKDNNEKGQGVNKGNKGNGKGQAAVHRSNADKRWPANERGRKEANVRANRPAKEGRGYSGVKADKLNKLANAGRGRSADHKKAKGKGSNFFSALGKARWSHNPHDDRGQGNMGKPGMRDPYGHDKDSGREKSERGRPIKESEMPQLSLEGLVNIDFSSLGYYQDSFITSWFESIVARYESNWEDYSMSRYTTLEQYIEQLRFHFFPGGDGNTGLLVNHRDSIDYNLSVENWNGGNLLVTTTMTAAQDYNSTLYTYDNGTRTTEAINYTSGDVIFEQTQEVVTDSGATELNYTQDLPGDIMGSYQNEAFYVDLNVTVTDPNSGASYTTTYDKQLYLYRCPYGKVYNADSGQAIVGAKITVHFEDGSIVPLDKASNPTASNPQMTDATGRYGAKLQTNRKYYVTAVAEGYKDYKSPIFTEKWHVLREDIAMKPVEGEKLILGQRKLKF